MNYSNIDDTSSSESSADNNAEKEDNITDLNPKEMSDEYYVGCKLCCCVSTVIIFSMAVMLIYFK